MRARHLIPVVAVATTAMLVVAFAFTRSFVDPRSRIEHEHGIRLPVSASSFECHGDAGRGFLDRGVSSAFIIASNELAGFISQLSARSGLRTFIPGNSQYQLHAAWRTGRPTKSSSCASPVGDWMHVEVWLVDDARVGVCLYTDWN